MATYIIRRALQGFVVLVASTVVIYGILIVTPGGPLDQLNSEGQKHPLPKPYKDALIHRYKLDRPYPLNYFLWLFDPSENTRLDPNDNSRTIPKGLNLTIGSLQIRGSGVLTGDFGNSVSIAKGVPVSSLIGARIGNTLLLTGSVLLLSILLAFPIGIISAIKQYSRLDYAVTAFSFTGLSMPAFWFGLLLILFFGVIAKDLHTTHGWAWLPYLPVSDTYDHGQEGNIINRVYHLVLPVTVLAFVSIAGYARYIRSSMLEVLRQDYVRTAWAKGLSQRVVILKHALRNALIPVITVLTLSLPFLLSGAILTETIFNYAGMGKLFKDAVFQLDIPVVMCFLMISTTLIIVSNILADVVYAVADPRIRYS